MFLENRHRIPLSQTAKRFNISLSTVNRFARESNLSKTREQYLTDAQLRRKEVWDLRQSGLKYREIAEMLQISTNNAQQLCRRYK